ncbi:MAG: hemolysin family protein [Clostridiales bacterium]|nr:hemolysin family protein [Clostridiales bacterium]
MEGSDLTHILIAICIVFSAYFSATETAMNSVNRIRLKSRQEKGDGKADLVLRLLEQYDKMLSTILIGNNIVNIAATSMATVIFVRLLGEDRGSGVATLVVTLVLLFFGEITPKSLAARFPERFAVFSAPILQFFMIVMTPITALFSLWKRLLHFLVKDGEDRSITEDELLTMVDVAEDEGGIDEQESALLRNSIDFMDQEAQDILTPRIDIAGVERGESREEIAAKFAETGYSRLPVYEGDLDHIVGILYQKDFYNKVYPGESDVASIVRPVIFVSEHRDLGSLLREMQQKKMQIAVVLDEFGGTRGIVTMEDILEELVGEIWDEHDEIVNEIEKVSDREYLVMGGTNLEKLMDELESTTESDALTVSGWVLEAAGHIPLPGEKLTVDGFAVTVLEMDERRVQRIRLEIPEDEKKEE